MVILTIKSYTGPIGVPLEFEIYTSVTSVIRAGCVDDVPVLLIPAPGVPVLLDIVAIGVVELLELLPGVLVELPDPEVLLWVLEVPLDEEPLDEEADGVRVDGGVTLGVPMPVWLLELPPVTAMPALLQ